MKYYKTRAYLKPYYLMFKNLLFDPRQSVRRIKGLFPYLRDIKRYKKLATNNKFRYAFKNSHPVLDDRNNPAGSVDNVYFLQDLWAANNLLKRGIINHVDVGSRIDGFVGHLLPYCKVDYIDIRTLKSNIENLNYIHGSLLNMPYGDNSVPSLSCLHVIEHVGLGRYGDEIDYDGYEKAAGELTRVLAPGGIMLFSTPVGKERVCFNAHRVFSPHTILEIFCGLKLNEFNVIPDKADRIIYNANINDCENMNYGCGLFVFQKGN